MQHRSDSALSKLAMMCMAITSVVMLKYWYSNAVPDDMHWVLWPLSQLTQFFTNLDFSFDAELGYVNYKTGNIIAPGCSGINFMCITFFMLSVQGIRKTSGSRLLMWSIMVPCITYGYSMFVNCLRILVSLWLYDSGMAFGYFTADRIHRIAGIVIFYTMLLALYFVTKKMLAQKTGFPADTKNDSQKKETYPYILPLLCYLFLTSLVPLVLAADKSSATLWEHLIFVTALCLVITILVHLLLRKGKKMSL